jgi:AcrR family transcriptional regulator
VVAEAVTRLPRGRHGLTREQVERDQRLRIVAGMAEALRTNGYAATPVADVLKHAGVSRETFYQLYDDKLSCFLAAFDLIGDVLQERLTSALLEVDGSPIERFGHALAAYLDALAAQPGYARLILVEVYAAGPEAMARRAVVQQRIVSALIELFDARGVEGAFACQMVVSAISAMVTGPLAAGDTHLLHDLHRPILDHVRRLDALGGFEASG